MTCRSTRMRFLSPPPLYCKGVGIHIMWNLLFPSLVYVAHLWWKLLSCCCCPTPAGSFSYSSATTNNEDDKSRGSRKSNFWSGWRQRRAKPVRQPTEKHKREKKKKNWDLILLEWRGAKDCVDSDDDVNTFAACKAHVEHLYQADYSIHVATTGAYCHVLRTRGHSRVNGFLV